jgi:hypothetical protein
MLTRLLSINSETGLSLWVKYALTAAIAVLLGAGCGSRESRTKNETFPLAVISHSVSAESTLNRSQAESISCVPKFIAIVELPSMRQRPFASDVVNICRPSGGSSIVWLSATFHPNTGDGGGGGAPGIGLSPRKSIVPKNTTSNISEIQTGFVIAGEMLVPAEMAVKALEAACFVS